MIGKLFLLVQSDAKWCNVLSMAQSDKSARQSISIPARIAKKVRVLAKNQKTSANRVLVALIEAGLESKEAERVRFFELADRLAQSKDPGEREQLKKDLARMTFGGE